MDAANKDELAALAFPHPGPLPPAGEGAENGFLLRSVKRSFRLRCGSYGATRRRDELARHGLTLPGGRWVETIDSGFDGVSPYQALDGFLEDGAGGMKERLKASAVAATAMARQVRLRRDRRKLIMDNGTIPATSWLANFHWPFGPGNWL
jgi:hypothetical protein